jgi:hypothetical protein
VSKRSSSIALLLITSTIPMQAEVGIRLLLGVTDKDPAKWDGSVSPSSGQVTKIDSWRFGKGDEISGSQWKVSTRPVSTFLLRAQNVPPAVAANGVIVWLGGEDENTELSIRTTQGNFKIKLPDSSCPPFAAVLIGVNGVTRFRPLDSPGLGLSGAKQSCGCPPSGHRGMREW